VAHRPKIIESDCQKILVKGKPKVIYVPQITTTYGANNAFIISDQES
jgi:hypothetical protein